MADPKTDKQIEAEAHVDTLVRRGLEALEQFRELNQEQVDYIVAKASVAALDQHGVLAKHAHEETRRGVFEDKATKNLFACEHVVNNMRHTKTVGVISEDEVTGLTLIAEPVGVVCGITPTTNPTSTAIFKSLIALKTRNPIVFAFHPSAQESSAHAAQVVYDAAVVAGAPEHCIQWITLPSIEATNALMNHDGIATILATGGNAMVRAAYSCGKPALGVGAGNVPAYVEKTADIRQAAHDIVMSKSFDNGMVCASEQAVYELGERVGIKMSFRDQGIDEKTWMAAAEEIAYLAYEDQCSPANPRLTMVSDMKEILEDAYYGYKTRPGRIK